MPGRIVAVALGLALLGTAMVATGPVTDGDALCYHLQVPKVFLMGDAAGFDPDLHETVYPLVTELIYAVALEFRGPVACRWIQWFLGLALAANVAAMARPGLGRRAWWAGAIVLLAPAISNGMSAPLNDVALAAFGAAAIFAWTRLLDRPSGKAAVVAGALAGLAIGVKYPALVLVGLMGGFLWLRGLKGSVAVATSRGVRPSLSRSGSGRLALRAGPPSREGRGTSRLPPRYGGRVGGSPGGNAAVDRACDARRPPRSPSLDLAELAAIYSMATLAVGGWWYLRAYVHTGNPVYPFFRHAFGGAGLDEVLDPIKRPMAVTPWNLLVSLIPLTLQPDRFDSFSHQFGPIFLLFLPVALLERPPRRVLGLAALGYLFLMVCLTQRQSMRFVLIALGPMSVAVAYGLGRWCDRKTVPARLMVALLLGALGLESGLAMVRCRHVLGLVAGRESSESLLSRREPTYVVGRWTARHLPAIGAADRPGPPGLLHPAPLHDGAGPPSADRAGPPGRRGGRDRRPPARVGLHPPDALPARAGGRRRVRPDPRPAAGPLAGPSGADLPPGPDRRRRRPPPIRDLRAVRRPAGLPPDGRSPAMTTMSTATRRRAPTLAELRARVHKGRHREIGNWLARPVRPPGRGLWHLAGGPPRDLGKPGDGGGLADVDGGGGGHRLGDAGDVRRRRGPGPPGILARPG